MSTLGIVPKLMPLFYPLVFWVFGAF